MTPPSGAVRPHLPGHSPKLTALKKYSDQWGGQHQSGGGALDDRTARMLTTQIKQSATQLWDLIVKAYQGKAWSALGYTSWDAYCTKEFQRCRLRLPREERAEVVASLRESGLSIRAIASATGLGRGTVEREIAPVPNGTPGAEPVDAEIVDAEIVDGGLSRPEAIEVTSPTEAEDDTLTDPVNVAPNPTALPDNVIGIDGKRYRRRQPQQRPTVRKTAGTRRAIEHLAVTLSALALSVTDIDPAEVDVARMRRELDVAGASVDTIRQFIKKVEK